MPILYLSPYFKSRRDEYYRPLNGVRADDGWEPWLEFFATATRDSALQAVETAHRVSSLIQAARAPPYHNGGGDGALVKKDA